MAYSSVMQIYSQRLSSMCISDGANQANSTLSTNWWCKLSYKVYKPSKLALSTIQDEVERCSYSVDRYLKEIYIKRQISLYDRTRENATR